MPGGDLFRTLREALAPRAGLLGPAEVRAATHLLRRVDAVFGSGAVRADLDAAAVLDPLFAEDDWNGRSVADFLVAVQAELTAPGACIGGSFDHAVAGQGRRAGDFE